MDVSCSPASTTPDMHPIKSPSTPSATPSNSNSNSNPSLSDALLTYIQIGLSDLNGTSQYSVQSRVPLDDLCSILSSPALPPHTFSQSPGLTNLAVESTQVAIMNLQLHSSSYLTTENLSKLEARSKTMLQVLTKFLSLAFRLFPVSEMFATIRLSPSLIDQTPFQVISMDGSVGDILSYLLIVFSILFKSPIEQGSRSSSSSNGGNKETSSVNNSSTLLSPSTKILLAENTSSTNTNTNTNTKPEKSLQHNLLSAISSLLTVRSHALRHLNFSPLRLPPHVSSVITTTTIDLITSPILSSSSSSDSSSSPDSPLLLSLNTLSILLRSSPHIRISLKTTSNSVFRNLTRCLLKLLTPNNPIPQVIGGLSVLAKLVNNNPIEEKVFDASNVEQTLGLIFNKVLDSAAPSLPLQRTAASVLNDLCTSAHVLRLIEHSPLIRNFLNEGWVRLVRLASSASASASATTTTPPEPLINCMLTLHSFCGSYARSVLIDIVSRNSNSESASHLQGHGKNHGISNEGCEKIMHTLLCLSNNIDVPTASAAANLLRCILLTSSASSSSITNYSLDTHSNSNSNSTKNNRNAQPKISTTDIAQRLWFSLNSSRCVPRIESIANRLFSQEEIDSTSSSSSSSSNSSTHNNLYASIRSTSIASKEPILCSLLELLCLVCSSASAAGNLIQSSAMNDGLKNIGVIALKQILTVKGYFSDPTSTVGNQCVGGESSGNSPPSINPHTHSSSGEMKTSISPIPSNQFSFANFTSSGGSGSGSGSINPPPKKNNKNSDDDSGDQFHIQFNHSTSSQNIILYGMHGSDDGSSSCIATNVVLSCCTLLSRLSVAPEKNTVSGKSSSGNEASDSRIDVLRRRRANVKHTLSTILAETNQKNVDEEIKAKVGFGGSFVAHLLSHATTQSYCRSLTQHALELHALIMRAGGVDALCVGDELFSYCSSSFEHLRSGLERINTTDRQLAISKSENDHLSKQVSE